MSEEKLSLKQTKKIANLAHIELSEKKLKQLQRQLGDVLEYVEKLNQVQTGEIKPTAQVSGLQNVYRDDKPVLDQRLTQEEALKNAPEEKNGYFKISSVF